MLIKNNSASRRRVLQGLLSGGAVSVSLPLLDLFLNDGGTAMAAGAPIPARFGTWFWGLGMNTEVFTPKAFGANYDLPDQLKSLDKVKQHVNVYSNYDVLTDGKSNLCHYTGWVALRTGSTPGSRAALPGQSLDVAVSDAIGGGTRFRSISLAATGSARDSFSFRSADAVNPPESSAVEFYQKVFGPEFQDPNSPTFTPDRKTMLRKSVLSGVLEESKDFSQTLGAADKQRMDQYFTSIRELESRLDTQLQKPPASPACVVPKKAPPETAVGLDVELVVARHRAMTDLLVMALACNQTKVFNMMYSDSGSSLVRTGVERTHHALSHEEPIDVASGRQPVHAWFIGRAMENWAYFVEAMAKTPEGDGSLLDHSLIYANSDCSFAKVHSLQGVPMFTAGKLNGKVKTGLHIDGKSSAGTAVGYTCQRLMGVPISSWGEQSMQATREIGEIIA
jgi:hypothetical protein